MAAFIIASPFEDRSMVPPASYCSKLKFKCKLDRARSTNLVERAETAIRAAGSQTVRQRLRRASEQGAGQAVVGTAEVRVVKDVEEFRSKTQRHVVGDVKLPLHSKI